ncbi:MAG: type I-C CRISPR-associated protein Cas5c [Armatimonadetes bacterium]|nr:type I-C CRISPR-associated protein Cas5c [Armatimonadota bacterium]
MNERYISVRVSGDFALFTRPESKAERVTYEVITPSAARGILEAIYWHPQFDWVIREIRVLRPIQTTGIFRNEVASKMSPSRTEPYYADHDRMQRHSVLLRDVAYEIYADANVRPGVTEDHAKFRAQFRDRVEKGQCFHRPALGCREFAAEFGPVRPGETPIQEDRDLGRMLFDMNYADKKRIRPMFFEARLEQGILSLPDPREVLR